MAGAQFTVQLADAAVQAMWRRLIEAGTNLKPLLTEIGSILEDSTKKRFSSQESPDDVAWSPLSQVTLDRKKTGRILYESGDLFDSIRFEAGADFVQLLAGPTEYAATHQFGRADNRMFGGPLAPIPARPFLGLSEDDQAEILDAMSDYLKRATG
ncbi:MAG: phage virion morphogenesis protein [Xanthomonadales bacterium]|nr:phage virion morphogenesis protein [Xanthomonadales bacterium]